MKIRRLDAKTFEFDTALQLRMDQLVRSRFIPRAPVVAVAYAMIIDGYNEPRDYANAVTPVGSTTTPTRASLRDSAARRLTRFGCGSTSGPLTETRVSVNPGYEGSHELGRLQCFWVSDVGVPACEGGGVHSPRLHDHRAVRFARREAPAELVLERRLSRRKAL